MLTALMKALIFETWKKIMLWAHAKKWEGVADATLAGFELSSAEKESAGRRPEKKLHLW